jgi:hypothetical protein
MAGITSMPAAISHLRAINMILCIQAISSIRRMEWHSRTDAAKLRARNIRAYRL